MSLMAKSCVSGPKTPRHTWRARIKRGIGREGRLEKNSSEFEISLRKPRLQSASFAALSSCVTDGQKLCQRAKNSTFPKLPFASPQVWPRTWRNFRLQEKDCSGHDLWKPSCEGLNLRATDFRQALMVRSDCCFL